MTEISAKEAARLLGISSHKLTLALKNGALVKELNAQVFEVPGGKNPRYILFEECVHDYINKMKRGTI